MSARPYADWSHDELVAEVRRLEAAKVDSRKAAEAGPDEDARDRARRWEGT